MRELQHLFIYYYGFNRVLTESLCKLIFNNDSVEQQAPRIPEHLINLCELSADVTGRQSSPECP